MIDDWGSTPAAEKKELEQRCERMGCGHMRYLHGTARTVRATFRYVIYEAGKCIRCRCAAFQDDKAIQLDEILDAHDILDQPIHLADFGIAVICEQRITRWLEGANTIEVPCGLTPGHPGAHVAKE